MPATKSRIRTCRRAVRIVGVTIGRAARRAYAACEALARSHYENFPVASRLLPAAMRPHVAAVYAFARVADDIADEGTRRPAERQEQLRAWQDRLHRAAADDRRGLEPRQPASRPSDRDELIRVALGHSIRSLDLPVALFDDLVERVRSGYHDDSATTRGPTCSTTAADRRIRSAGSCSASRGYRDDALDRSSDALCTALQLTNFWQDFGRDWRAGRLYVPAGGAGRLRRQRGRAGGRTAAPRGRALERRVAMTREMFDEGRHVCDGVSGRLRMELRFTWLGGVRILERVERGRADLLDHRPALGAAMRRAAAGGRAGGLAHTERLMARKTSFYYSFLVLPAEQRRAIIAVWDFCRAVDDAVDERPRGERTCRSGARRSRSGGPSSRAAMTAAKPPTAQGRRLQPFVRRFDLPRQAFEDVIDGVAMDLDTTRYATFADLFEYCRRVASAVGLVCIRIFGCRSARRASTR